jgi:catechol 2,3-dioxygenase-like lactoylglutathione lyase family enzyme
MQVGARQAVRGVHFDSCHAWRLAAYAAHRRSGGTVISLSDYEVGAGVAVSDMDRAREFYEGKLGLSGGEGSSDGGTTYRCGGNTAIHVYPSPDNAGRSPATLAGWEVDDLDAVVDELTSRGVAFEQYDQPPIVTDEKGIATFEDGRVAYFKDPDGNTLSLGSQE